MPFAVAKNSCRGEDFEILTMILVPTGGGRDALRTAAADSGATSNQLGYGAFLITDGGYGGFEYVHGFVHLLVRDDQRYQHADNV